MQTDELVTTIVVSLLGGGTVGALGNKLLNRKLDSATVGQIKAETEKIATDSARDQVELMRQVAQEMRVGYEQKIEEFGSERGEQRSEISHLKSRVAKLEERERHMLTRAAVHEAWDQMAFKIISQHNPEHPAPPPLLHKDGSNGEG
jgi:hypothetical protein